MSDAEFDVIKKYFSFKETRDDVLVANGDDCAGVSVPTGSQLMVTVDTLIAGVHFPENTSAADVAYKSLMVNLSDLASMGAVPAWVTLAISLPEINENWLEEFSSQFAETLDTYDVSLIGGDTTRGTLSLTVQAMGLCHDDKVLRRKNAQVGDKIFVTGYLGDAAVGLQVAKLGLMDTELSACVQRLNRPEARVGFSQGLTRYSNCCIDISDGLIADLGHVLDASGCGATIDLASLPVSAAANYYFTHYNDNEIDWQLIAAHGDDYELCFTASEAVSEALYELADKHGLKLSCIGTIDEASELKVVNEEGSAVLFSESGFNHFR